MNKKILLISILAGVLVVGSAITARIYNPIDVVTGITNGVFNTLISTSTTATSTFAGAVQIGTTVGTAKLQLTAPSGSTYPASNSTGGMFNLTNTNNTGAGAVLYSNTGSTADGVLLNVRCDNSAYDQNCEAISNDGTGVGLSVNSTGGAGISASASGNSHAGVFNYTGTDSSSAGLNVISSNPNFSAMGLTGQELTHGTLKITHTGTSTGADANAAALSIDLTATGTAAQGIYLTTSVGASSGTTGNLLTLRNTTSLLAMQYMLVVKANGKTGFGTSTPTSTAQFIDTTANATSTITLGQAGQAGCLSAWSKDDNAYVYFKISNAGMTTTTRQYCGL